MLTKVSHQRCQCKQASCGMLCVLDLCHAAHSKRIQALPTSALHTARCCICDAAVRTYSSRVKHMVYCQHISHGAYQWHISLLRPNCCACLLRTRRDSCAIAHWWCMWVLHPQSSLVTAICLLLLLLLRLLLPATCVMQWIVNPDQPKWDQWGRLFEPLLSHVPFIHTNGNHEVGLLGCCQVLAPAVACV